MSSHPFPSCQFIRHLVEDKDAIHIGHDSINPQTVTITEYPAVVGGKSVILVDTPGLDSPGGVFEDLVQWMANRPNP